MRARIEPVAGAGDDLDIPMPAMAPAYRVGTPRRSGTMDPATRRLATFAGVIGGAFLLLVGAWSLSGRHHAGVPVIEADSRPLRVKPANPGGMQVEGANDSILSGESDGKEAMAPPPEIPAPQALKAEEQQPVAARTEAATAAAPPPPAPAPAVVAEARPVVPPPPPKPVAAPPPRPAAAAMPVAARPAGALVQLAAVDSEEAAKQEWLRLSHKYGDLLGGRTPAISRTEHAGRTYWRVRTGGFADTAQAVQFCERVKAKGGGCSVASF